MCHLRGHCMQLWMLVLARLHWCPRVLLGERGGSMCTSLPAFQPIPTVRLLKQCAVAAAAAGVSWMVVASGAALGSLHAPRQPQRAHNGSHCYGLKEAKAGEMVTSSSPALRPALPRTSLIPCFKARRANPASPGPRQQFCTSAGDQVEVAQKRNYSLTGGTDFKSNMTQTLHQRKQVWYECE